MTDPFVKLLNDAGYQPIFAQRTGLEPPDVYAFVRKQLIRLGSFSSFVPKGLNLQKNSGALVDLEGKQTDRKVSAAATSFLASALQGLGFDGRIGFNFKFSEHSELVFSIKGITFSSVDPISLAKSIKAFSVPASMPEKYVLGGRLHVAYEYAYSSVLQISRADGAALSEDVKALMPLLDLKGRVAVKMENQRRMVLTNRASPSVAFAYKAARLTKIDGNWLFEPGELSRAHAAVVRQTSRPFILARGLVLHATEADERQGEQSNSVATG